MLAMVIELQEQLLVQERELGSRENALIAWEDDLAATERALGRARMECDAECDRAEAVQWDYRARMRASTVGFTPAFYNNKILSNYECIRLHFK
jgi:hypothetical protein